MPTNPETPPTDPALAQRVLLYFPSSYIQYLDDSPKKDGRKALSVDHFDAKQAAKKQAQGCGVYFSPNAFEGERKIEKLVHIQAVFADIDLAKENDGQDREEVERKIAEMQQMLKSVEPTPHLIIGTKNGVQAVWRVLPVGGEEAVLLFREVEALIIEFFGADKGAKDPTRVLRLPGFLHLKNPDDPFLCTVVHDELDKEAYELSALRRVFAETLSSIKGEDPTVITAPTIEAALSNKKWKSVVEGVQEGQRNDAATSIAGKILSELPEELWEKIGWSGFKEWNKGNTPPLAETELRGVFNSIAKRQREERGKKQNQSQASLLVALVTPENAVLFIDQLEEPHAHILAGTIWRTCTLRSKVFRRWLSQKLWDEEGTAANTDALSSAINILESKACFEGKQITLGNRVTWHEGGIWYDLSDGRAVRITHDGWEIVEQPPILFRRFAHQDAQMTPVRGGSLTTLFEHVHIPDEASRVLLSTTLVSYLIPGIPHPILNTHGPQGAAKTTSATLLHRLIDPSKMDTISLPTNGQELVQMLSHHWFAFFDNVSEVTDNISDLLCRAVTGLGISKRQLYTDDDDVIYVLKHCIGINGINPSARKPDLLDRVIMMRLERIPQEQRKEERVVFEAFDRDRPAILGALFDMLSKAMQLRDSIELPTLPRMADYCRWGCAIAIAQGYTQEAFLTAYNAVITAQHEEAIRENPVAVAVEAMIEVEGRWEGSMSGLLEKLTQFAETEKLDTHGRDWPKAPNILSRRLNEARTNLTEIGIEIIHEKGGQGRRRVIVQKVAPDTATTASSPQTLWDIAESTGGDGMSEAKITDQVSPLEEALDEEEIARGGDGGDSTEQVEGKEDNPSPSPSADADR